MSSASFSILNPSAITTSGTICSNGTADVYTNVAVVTEQGYFANILWLTQQLGRALGAPYDGTTNATACPASGNYIMSTSWNLQPDGANVANLRQFSTCSVSRIKLHLMIGLTQIRPLAYCLINIPTNLPVQTIQLSKSIWTPTEQCQIIFGPTYRFCPVISLFIYSGFFITFSQLYINMQEFRDSICATLYCSNSSAVDGPCAYSTLYTALDGTICGSGQVNET